MTAADLEGFAVYAFVGLDELGSGEVGLKQGVTRAGVVIPLVAVRRDKLEQDDLLRQMRAQVATYGKTVRLVRLDYAETVLTIEGRHDSSGGHRRHRLSNAYMHMFRHTEVLGQLCSTCGMRWIEDGQCDWCRWFMRAGGDASGWPLSCVTVALILDGVASVPPRSPHLRARALRDFGACEARDGYLGDMRRGAEES